MRWEKTRKAMSALSYDIIHGNLSIKSFIASIPSAEILSTASPVHLLLMVRLIA
jgi:hypothetical protein